MASGLFLGSNIVQLVYVEVTPLTFTGSLSCSIVKHLLQKLSLETSFSWKKSNQQLVLEWTSNEPILEDVGDTGKEKSPVRGKPSLVSLECGYLKLQNECDEGSTESFDEYGTLQIAASQDRRIPILYFPSEDPADFNALPCCVKAYGRRSNLTRKDSLCGAAVTSSTLVQILPVQLIHPSLTDQIQNDHMINVSGPRWHARERFLQSMLGYTASEISKDMKEEVLRNHNPETVRTLARRMSRVLSEPVFVGTTPDAFIRKKTRQTRSKAMQRMIDRYYNIRGDHSKHPIDGRTGLTFASIGSGSGLANGLQWEPSIIVHSPNNAAGKTLLVQAIADSGLEAYNPTVHLIEGPALFARFGIHADVALESIVHEILVRAAASNQSRIIVLDQLDSMLPPHFSSRTSAGDSGVPVLNAIASYLKNMTRSLQRTRQVPFPAKNPLYNVSGCNGAVLPVRLCLVGIITCPDDGWRTSSGASGGSSCIFDCLVGGRYRLDSLDSATRFRALLGAFEANQIDVDEQDKSRLAVISASAAWVQGKLFRQIAEELSNLIAKRSMHKRVATTHDIQRAIAAVRSGNVQSFATIDFECTPAQKSSSITSSSKLSPGSDLFGMVGGNIAAKQSLEDALALDPAKRRMLGKFGLSPATGILLYGPPGTGKTLLAKAVAKLLKSSSSSIRGSNDEGHMSLGGAFVSLTSSDIVRAEIGESEKLVASAFEVARKNAPSVIFIDEFQALFTARDNEGSGRLASTLLQAMDDTRRWRDVGIAGTIGGLDKGASGNTGELQDGVEAVEQNRVVVIIGATNVPWSIDKAFYRPGRFDRVVHVGLPSVSERQSILLVHMRRMKIHIGEDRPGLDVLSAWIADRTVGFSGADLAALCRAAAIRCLGDTLGSGNVTRKHFEESLNHDIFPSSSQDFVRRIEEWRPGM